MKTEDTIRGWLAELEACVRAVDYDRAMHLFAPEVTAFGTFAGVAQGLESVRAEQWSKVWPNIRDFTFRVDMLRCGAAGTAEGAVAWAACPWASTGLSAGGSTFERPGRMTVVLERRNGQWLAVHTHFSLYPGP